MRTPDYVDCVQLFLQTLDDFPWKKSLFHVPESDVSSLAHVNTNAKTSKRCWAWLSMQDPRFPTDHTNVVSKLKIWY